MDKNLGYVLVLLLLVYDTACHADEDNQVFNSTKNEENISIFEAGKGKQDVKEDNLNIFLKGETLKNFKANYSPLVYEIGQPPKNLFYLKLKIAQGSDKKLKINLLLNEDIPKPLEKFINSTLLKISQNYSTRLDLRGKSANIGNTRIKYVIQMINMLIENLLQYKSSSDKKKTTENLPLDNMLITQLFFPKFKKHTKQPVTHKKTTKLNLVTPWNKRNSITSFDFKRSFKSSTTFPFNPIHKKTTKMNVVNPWNKRKSTTSFNFKWPHKSSTTFPFNPIHKKTTTFPQSKSSSHRVTWKPKIFTPKPWYPFEKKSTTYNRIRPWDRRPTYTPWINPISRKEITHFNIHTFIIVLVAIGTILIFSLSICIIILLCKPKPSRVQTVSSYPEFGNAAPHDGQYDNDAFVLEKPPGYDTVVRSDRLAYAERLKQAYGELPPGYGAVAASAPAEY